MPPNETARNPKVPGASFYDDLAVQSNIESKLRRSIDYRLASAINRAASLSTSFRFPLVLDSRRCRQSPTDLRQLSIIGGASEPTSNFFRLLHSPVPLSNPASGSRRLLHPPTHLRINFQLFIGPLIFQLTFRSTSDLRRRSIVQSCLRTDHQLTSAIASSGFTFAPTRNLRRVSRSPVLPSNQHPTLHRISRL